MKDKHELFPSITWWIGVVENRYHPLGLNQFQVRIYSLHTPDQEVLPTEDLMWAMVLMPTTSASVSGVGTSPAKIMQGSTVMGMFLDGERAQQPVIMGTLAGVPTWTAKDRTEIVKETPLAELASMFNENNNIEEDYSALPDGSLTDMLLKRFEFEGPHIIIKPNLDYENTLSTTLTPIGGASGDQMMVFRYCAAIFLSNINYLCVSSTGRVGKYQFTPKFLISKGLLAADDVFDHKNWIGEDAHSLTEFLQSYELQEQLFSEWLSELGVAGSTIKDAFSKAMVGLIVNEGLNNWSESEIYSDEEGRDTADAFMKGLLAAHIAEELDE